MNDVPSQPAPRREDDPAMGDWADALKDRGRPTRVLAEDWTRRRLALIGIVIALLFPFYQYAVQRELVRRELREAERAAEAAMRDAAQAAAASARQARADRMARALKARIGAVRVVGVIDGNPRSWLSKTCRRRGPPRLPSTSARRRRPGCGAMWPGRRCG